MVARLNGVQEAVSSILATRTKDGCQGQQERQIRKDLALFCFLRLQSRQRLLQAVCDGTLAAYVQMAVDVRGHLDVRVAQPLLHVFQAVALRQQHAGAGVPLQYNYDKPEKPRRIKGFEVFSLVFSSFSKPKNHTEISRIIGGVSLTTNE